MNKYNIGNREIKFRAWDSLLNEMIYLGDISEIADRTFITEDQRESFWSNHIKPLQFTGLLDKNGKEIYEGDVFTVIFADCPNGFKMLGRDTQYIKNNGVVIKEKGSWVISVEDETGEVMTSYLYQFLNKNPKEVIGNIFENENLLTNKPNTGQGQ